MINFTYFSSQIQAESLGSDFLPPAEKTSSAHCVPVTDDGKVVTVHIISRGYDIPGGHLELGETAEQAMKREVYEEAFIRVGEPVLVDVWSMTSPNQKLGLTERPYLVIYAARVEAIDEFVSDDETDQRALFAPDEFVEHYFGDKTYARKLIDKTITIML